MQISTNQFKTGMAIEIDGTLFFIVDFQHVKPGKGGAFVRTKLKNVITGASQDKTFRAGEKFEMAHLEHCKMQYLYKDGEDYNFMDNSSFEQMILTPEQLGDVMKYVKENTDVDVLMHEGRPIGIEPPIFVELEVVETDPGLRGDTATGATKPATLETGAVVQVPLFVNIGDHLKIDTRTDTYITRV
ncbi:MAG TPA: elongation factor P [Actinobacteria bacterium]|nr:elongation factor P [Actinomycetota bacterium]